MKPIQVSPVGPCRVAMPRTGMPIPEPELVGPRGSTIRIGATA
jgi:hypothetical protein